MQTDAPDFAAAVAAVVGLVGRRVEVMVLVRGLGQIATFVGDVGGASELGTDDQERRGIPPALYVRVGTLGSIVLDASDLTATDVAPCGTVRLHSTGHELVLVPFDEEPA